MTNRREILLALICTTSLAFAFFGFHAAAQQPSPRQASPQAPGAQPQGPLVGPMARIVGQAVFNKNCASCHHHAMTSADQQPVVVGGRVAPTTETLAQMTPEAIYATLTTGDMAAQAQNLADSEKRAVAEFFGGRPLGAADAGDASHMTNHCASNPPFSLGDVILGAAPTFTVWNGWGNGFANARFQSAQFAGLSAADVPHLKLKWAFGLPAGGETSGQPAVVGGRIFFGDYNSFAYSLDAATGCVYWSFHADAQIRTAAFVEPIKRKGSTPDAVLFGDKKANLYALDARTGTLLWKRNLEPRLLSHITAAPVFYKGRLYVGLAGSKKSFPPIRTILAAPIAAALPRSTRIPAR